MKPEKELKLPQWSARNFLLTIKADLLTEDEITAVLAKALDNGEDQFLRYAVGQLEVGETGYRHYQIYLETYKTSRAARVLKLFGSEAAASINIEKRKGSRSDARYYCMKDHEGKYDDSYFWDSKGRPEGTDYIEYGYFKPDTNSRKKAIEKLNTAIEEADTWADLLNNNEVSGTLKGSMRYARERFLAKPVKPMEGVVLRPWQIALENEVLQKADDRKVVWYTDFNGGQGKTFMAKYLVANHGAIVLGGEAKDMFYGYNNQNIVIFDLSFGDTYEDEYGIKKVPWNRFQYPAMEKIKDGLMFNTKYESTMKFRPEPCHVIIFANGMPDTDRLAADRWDIRELSVHTEEETDTFFSRFC